MRADERDEDPARPVILFADALRSFEVLDRQARIYAANQRKRRRTLSRRVIHRA